MMGMFFFLTQFLQDILGFSPLRAGIAFLPMTIMVFGVSRAAPRLMAAGPGDDDRRHGARHHRHGVAVPRVARHGYWTGVIGPMVLLGGGMGMVFVPLTTASLAGVPRPTPARPPAWST